MSILNAASQYNVLKGFDYYKDNRVLSCEKISEGIYKGEIKGSGDNIYNVILNVDHPRKSTCDCPYADGNQIICKHKIALYFYLYPEEAKDFEEWLYSGSDITEDSDEEEYYDDEYYNDRHYYSDTEVVPYCYDELLEAHINSMDIKQLKDFVRTSLNKDRENTFKSVLKEEYQNYLLNNKYYSFVEELHKNMSSYEEVYDYNYTDFNIEILKSIEKRTITKIYGKDKHIDELIDDVLLSSKLSMYKGFKWIINFYKNNLNVNRKVKLIDELNQQFINLKHYSIKNKDCKSNVLISIFQLKNYSENEMAISVVKNMKYTEYVKYVISNYKNIDSLYLKVKDILNKGHDFNKSEAPELILMFADRFRNNSKKYEKVLEDNCYYEFVFNNSETALKCLIYSKRDDMLENIKNNLKDCEQEAAYYSAYKDYKNLYKTIVKSNKNYLFDRYSCALKEQYNIEMYNYYKSRIFSILQKEMSRETYYEAMSNLKYIRLLNDSDTLLDDLYKELKESKYGNRPALFDEFRKARNGRR